MIPDNYKRPFAYLRVSSLDQSLERQRELIKPYNIAEEDIFEEKKSGKDLERPEFLRLMSILRKGDILYIESYSRISRSMRDFFNILDQLEKKGVELFSIKENSFFDNSPTGKLCRNMILSMAQFERDILRERQKEGIKIAKEKGVYGQKKQPIRIPSNFQDCFEKYNNRKNNYRMKDFMKETALKKTTLYKIINEFKNNTVHPNRFLPSKKKKKL